MAAQPIPSESTTTTTTTTKYRPPQPGLLSNVHLSSDAAVIGILAGLAYLFTLRSSTPSGTAVSPAPPAPSGVATPTGVTSPPSGPPGAPAELYELGATDHSVLVSCSPVTGAVEYDWYEYGTNAILARSPTNVALIQGLQSNTMYQVYCVAVGYDGQAGPPSAPLLISTTAGGPSVYVTPPQQVNIVLQMLTTPGAAPGSSTPPPTSATTETPPTLTVQLAPYSLVQVVGQTALIRATVTGVPSGSVVTWSWSVSTPYGPIATQPVTTSSTTSQVSVPLAQPGTYRLTVTASAAGASASASATFQAVVEQPAQSAASSTPSALQQAQEAAGSTPTGGSLYQQAASGALNGQLSPAQALTLARAGKIPGPGFVVVVPGQGPVWYQNLNQIPPDLRPLAAVNSGEVATAVSAGVSATGQGGQSSYIQDVLHGGITPSAQVSGSQQAQYAAQYQRLGIIPSLQQLRSAPSEIQAEQQGIRALQQAGASPQAIENYLVQLYGYSPQIAAEEVAQGFPVLQQNPNQYS